MTKDAPSAKSSKEQKGGGNLTQNLVAVNRVAKVVKGGKRFGFSALAVAGDRSGCVGYGMGKAKEVSKAVKKAMDNATKNMQRVPLKEARTIHHDIYASFGAGAVQLRTAPQGTGVIAGGPMRAVFDALGVQDVVGKSLGSSCPHNMVKATFKALLSSLTPRYVAAKRGKPISAIFNKPSSKTRQASPQKDVDVKEKAHDKQ
jgi:small subunit ribosomal protein S5